MQPSESTKAANVNYETVRKWEKTYNQDLPFKKTIHTSNRPASKLNDQHKAHLTNFFDENPSAIIQDAVKNLTKSFEGLEIMKNKVTEFMIEECNLSIKVTTRHPLARNSNKTLVARAKFIEEWLGIGEILCTIVSYLASQAST